VGDRSRLTGGQESFGWRLADDVWQVILMLFLDAARLFWGETWAELHLLRGETAAEFQQRQWSSVKVLKRKYWCSGEVVESLFYMRLHGGLLEQSYSRSRIGELRSNRKFTCQLGLQRTNVFLGNKSWDPIELLFCT
jgi:hypothetical protein